MISETSAPEKQKVATDFFPIVPHDCISNNWRGKWSLEKIASVKVEWREKGVTREDQEPSRSAAYKVWSGVVSPGVRGAHRYG